MFTHVYTCAHIHIQVGHNLVTEQRQHTHSETRTYTHTQTLHTHTPRHTRTHIEIKHTTRRDTHITHTHTYTQIHTHYTCAQTHPRAHTEAHTQTDTRWSTRGPSCSQTAPEGPWLPAGGEALGSRRCPPGPHWCRRPHHPGAQVCTPSTSSPSSSVGPTTSFTSPALGVSFCLFQLLLYSWPLK